MFLFCFKTARVKLEIYTVKSVVYNDIYFSLYGILLYIIDFISTCAALEAVGNISERNPHKYLDVIPKNLYIPSSLVKSEPVRLMWSDAHFKPHNTEILMAF